jgi:biopolymer transport protein ExbB/TolQ
MRMEEVWLIGMLAVATPLLVVCAAGWWRAQRRAQRLEQQLLASPERAETTQRLEQVVEGLASQFDELANGHEFLQRMIANRLAQRIQAPAEPPKATTPV